MAVSTAPGLVLRDFSSGYTAEIFRAGTVIPIGGLIQDEFDSLVVGGSLLALRDFELGSAVLNFVDWYGDPNTKVSEHVNSSYYRKANTATPTVPTLTVAKADGAANPVITLAIQDYTWNAEQTWFDYSGSDAGLTGSVIEVTTDAEGTTPARTWDFASGDTVTFYFLLGSFKAPVGLYNLNLTLTSSLTGTVGFPLTRTFIFHTGTYQTTAYEWIVGGDPGTARRMSLVEQVKAVRVVTAYIQKPTDFDAAFSIRFGKNDTTEYYSEAVAVGLNEVISATEPEALDIPDVPYVLSADQVADFSIFPNNGTCASGQLLVYVGFILFFEEQPDEAIPNEEEEEE